MFVRLFWCGIISAYVPILHCFSASFDMASSMHVAVSMCDCMLLCTIFCRCVSYQLCLALPDGIGLVLVVVFTAFT